jgi:hypothetical protein
MQTIWRRRPSPAALIALLALFVALGGSAYAVKLGKNSVRTKNIRNGAVTEAKLGNGAVTEAKLGNGAVTEAKLGNGAVTKTKIAAGAVGAESVRDVVVRSASKPLPDGSNVLVTASCAPGERLTGGTGNVSASNSPDIVVTGAYPSTPAAGLVNPGESATAWTVLANNFTGENTITATATAFVLCLT